jgi:hypothetical protein
MGKEMEEGEGRSCRADRKKEAPCHLGSPLDSPLLDMKGSEPCMRVLCSSPR